MGSVSDWAMLRHITQTLERLGVAHEVCMVCAHRTPALLFDYASAAQTRGIEAIIAGAGGAAHLPGVAAAKTVLPVIGICLHARSPLRIAGPVCHDSDTELLFPDEK